ncbi:MAG TPA: FAD-binding oxidoreductase [Nocardioides sp.]|jgi:FAD/FMN-containing dehydrogenase|nr:FAD-binding oxidoreductase [Nocardioides sp.]
MTTTSATLRRDFGGDIIEPGDDRYAAASGTVLAAGSPAYVLRPTDVGDVQAGIAFAREQGLALAVRGGGHGFAGFGTNADGVVLDLTGLDSVEVVDEERNIVRIGGGATWGQVADALGPLGLAISAGDTRSVGVGGLTLTGGIGWKVRKHGLALDNVVAVEVVTGTGEVLRASGEENAELFWAIRGGGGNFGVVTAFEFLAHPTTDVHFGTLSFPAAEAATVLAGWAEYFRDAPEGVTSNVVLANPFLGGPEAPVQVLVAYDGDDADEATRALAPLRALGTVLQDDITRKPYGDILEEGMVPPPGIEFLTRSGFADADSAPKVLQILAESAATAGSPIIGLRSVGGAVSRVPDDATAYAHRDAALMFVTTSVGPRPAIDAARPRMAELWESLGPHVSGAYANFLSGATAEDVAAVYPVQTYRRLAAVKHRYDPDNLFAGNLNVRPQ